MRCDQMRPLGSLHMSSIGVIVLVFHWSKKLSTTYMILSCELFFRVKEIKFIEFVGLYLFNNLHTYPLHVRL